MIDLKIEVRNLKEVRDYFNKLPKKIQKELGTNLLNELSINLQKKIKRRASVGSGWLRRSVVVEKPTKNRRMVLIHAYYAMAVEKGRKTNMIIPMQFIEQHYNNPEYPGHRVNKPNWVNLQNTAAAVPRPFISTSIQALRPQIPEIVKKYLEKTMRK